MLLPIGDDDRALTGTAYVTIALLGINVLVFFLLQQAGGNPAFTYGWSVIPLEITQGIDLTTPQSVAARGQDVTIPQAPGPEPIYWTILTAMFMHGGYAHLFGNLLYLWIFGDNVEHRLGSVGFLAFYLACGVAATVAQIALQPDGVLPNLGASGAISGVLGAYLVFYPRNRVYALFFYAIVTVPAVVAIGLWIAFQFLNGLGSIAASAATGGVAYGAHIGGFIAGVVGAGLVRLFGTGDPSDPRDAVYQRHQQRRF
jgi:membrane associated rhomboid family serine protease